MKGRWDSVYRVGEGHRHRIASTKVQIPGEPFNKGSGMPVGKFELNPKGDQSGESGPKTIPFQNYQPLLGTRARAIKLNSQSILETEIGSFIMLFQRFATETEVLTFAGADPGFFLGEVHH